MDEEHFAEFFRVMYPRLVAYARRFEDLPGAQDAAASAMETLWRKRPGTPRTEAELGGLQSLTFSILRGHLRNAHRSRERRAALAERIAITTDDRVEPTEVAERPKWLRRLASGDREVLALAGEGYTAPEIAIIIGCRPAAAAKRLTRAKDRAREAMRGDGDAPPEHR